MITPARVRQQWRLAALLGLLLGAALGLAACGGPSQEERDAAAARTYARQVETVSTRTGDELVRVSGRASYRDAEAAAASTRAFAAAIRTAAGQLRQAAPPERVARLHGELVALYAQTARALDALAVRFAAAADPPALAALAQELSTSVQAYGTREQSLRNAIQRELAGSIATTPVVTTPAPAAD